MWAPPATARPPDGRPAPWPRTQDGNLQHGGLQLVCQAVGVLGCFQFLEGHYLLLVTKKRFQGTLCGGFPHLPGCGKSALGAGC